MKKYIYYFTISTINANIDMEKFPIVYESSKEVVFVIGKGTTKKMYKDDCNLFKNLNNEDIINILKSREVEIINELTEAKNNISFMHNKLMHDIDEYNKLIEVYKDCDFIKDGDYETIKLF